MNTQNTSASGFSEMKIDQKILTTLTRLNFTNPTPIQHQAIPVAIEGNDIVGIAQTGTGKTLAFSIPLLHQLIKGGKRALIVLPTRELAIQVEETFHKISVGFNIHTALLIGGAFIGRQIQSMKRNPQVIIGTPGRIIDLAQNRNLNLKTITHLVLDEADRMFDIGFAPQIKRILSEIPAERQTMLFSATMPDEIAEVATKFMKTPLRIEVATQGTANTHIEQEIILVDKAGKDQMLKSLIEKFKGSILVFSRTKVGAKKIRFAIGMWDKRVTEIHSNKSLSQRREAISGFKSGKYRILVATDIAARGIDVTGIELIINYDMPEAAEDYVHRIGRTGRAGQTGHAISFATPDQHGKIHRIQRLIRTTINLSDSKGQAIEQGSLSRGGGGGGSFRSGGRFGKRSSGGRSSYGEKRSYGDRGGYGSRSSDSRPEFKRSDRGGYGERSSDSRPEFKRSDRGGYGTRSSDSRPEFKRSDRGGYAGRSSDSRPEFKRSDRGGYGTRSSDSRPEFKRSDRGGYGERSSDSRPEFKRSDRGGYGERSSDSRPPKRNDRGEYNSRSSEFKPARRRSTDSPAPRAKKSYTRKTSE